MLQVTLTPPGNSEAYFRTLTGDRPRALAAALSPYLAASSLSFIDLA